MEYRVEEGSSCCDDVLVELTPDGSREIARFVKKRTVASDAIELLPEEMILLREAGYIVLRTQLNASLVEAALRVLHPKIASCVGGWASNKHSAPEILRLADPLLPLLRRILQDPSISAPNHAQVAIVGIDTSGRALEPGEIGKGCHIDGLHAPGNGVPPNRVHNYSILVGVMLTALRVSNAGNLAVIPTSHRLLSRALREKHGGSIDCLRVAKGCFVRDSMEKAFGSSPLEAQMPAPVVVLGEAGTVCLAQYGTAHFVHSNVHGSEPRVAVYFRFTRKRRIGMLQGEGILDPLLELPGLNQLLG
jgi:hypothetical protein